VAPTTAAETAGIRRRSYFITQQHVFRYYDSDLRWPALVSKFSDMHV
jgi:hypothetical protein